MEFQTAFLVRKHEEKFETEGKVTKVIPKGTLSTKQGIKIDCSVWKKYRNLITSIEFFENKEKKGK